MKRFAVAGSLLSIAFFGSVAFAARAASNAPPVTLAAYCTPANASNCSAGSQLTRFSLKGEANSVDNVANACTVGGVAYRDNTAAIPAIQMARGDTYSGFLRTQSANGYVTVWIDFNDNNDFEDTERLLDNLPINTVDKLYGIYIPSTSPLGVRRLRVRNVDAPSPPSAMTSPCASYALGDTTDYLIEITATGATRSVAPGTPGSCSTAAEMTIGPSSNNSDSVFVSLVDANNNYVAGLSPNGNNLGNIKPSFYVHNGSVRQDTTGRHYLDRNITIASQMQPREPYTAWIYYRNAELNALISQLGSEVTTQFDLVSTKSDIDTCTTNYWNATSSLSPALAFGVLSGDRFIGLPNLRTLSSFFLHGGSSVLAAQIGQFAIISNPANLSIVQGASAYFVATASGYRDSNAAPPTIQWFESSDGGASFTPISGATSTRLSFTSSVADHNKQYRAVFTLLKNGANQQLTTIAATLYLTNGPVLNVDDSDVATTYVAATDGVLLLRYLLGLRGTALIADARGAGPSLRDAAQVEAHLAANLSLFDVDGDRQVSALSDGLMILRRLLSPGIAVTDTADTASITANAKRTARSDEAIVRAIDSLMP
jgi:hypothetical protein